MKVASLLLLSFVCLMSGCASTLTFLGLSRDSTDSVAIFPVEGEPRALLNTTQLESDGQSPAAEGKIPELRSFPGQTENFTALGLSPDGESFYVGSEDGTVQRYRLFPSRQVERVTLFRSERPILALAVSPDGARIAFAQTSQVAVFDLEKRTAIYALTLVKGRITALDWDPRGELLAIGTAGGDIAVWSMRQGLFEGQGRNSQDALEYYTGGKSPIISLRFHPSGATFFSAEAEGVISHWRLFRTEREIGLRDRWAVSDQKNQTARRQVLGTLQAKVSDLWLDEEGRTLYVSGSDGRLHVWKVRGLKSFAHIQIARDEQFTVSGYSLSRGNRMIDLIFSAGREQRVTLLCRPKPVIGSTTNEENDSTPPRIVARSVSLRTPLSRLRIGVKGHLWGAEKNERLWILDANRLLASPSGQEVIAGCLKSS